MSTRPQDALAGLVLIIGFTAIVVACFSFHWALGVGAIGVGLIFLARALVNS